MKRSIRRKPSQTIGQSANCAMTASLRLFLDLYIVYFRKFVVCYFSCYNELILRIYLCAFIRNVKITSIYIRNCPLFYCIYLHTYVGYNNFNNKDMLLVVCKVTFFHYTYTHNTILR